MPNPINVTGETAAQSAAKLVPAAWGSVGIQSGGIAVINAATFQYGGGEVNTQNFTIPSQSVLAFILDYTDFNLNHRGSDAGSYVYITNNNFYHNFDAAMQIEPNGLLGGQSAHAIGIRKSVPPWQRDDEQRNRRPDGPDQPVYIYIRPTTPRISAPAGDQSQRGYYNLSVNSVWDLTDITYVLQGTLIMRCVQSGFDRAICSHAPFPATTYTARPPRRSFHSPFRRPYPEPCSRTVRRFPARGNRSSSSCTTTTRPTTRPLIWRRPTGQRESCR